MNEDTKERINAMASDLLTKLNGHDLSTYHDRETVNIFLENVHNLMRKSPLRFRLPQSSHDEWATNVTIIVSKNFHSFHGESQFTTWLHTVACNEAGRENCRNNRLKSHEITETDMGDDGRGGRSWRITHHHADHVPLPLERILQSEEAALVRKVVEEVMGKLRFGSNISPEKKELHKELLIKLLMKEKEVTSKSVGDALGIDEGTIRTQIHRIKNAVRDCLTKNHDIVGLR